MDHNLKQEIAEVKERISQYKHRIDRLIQQQKVEQRKARTRRLIERGAILESLITGAEDMTNEEIKAMLQATLPPKITKLPDAGDSLG